MLLSHSVVLRIAASAIATTFVGFGVNAILRPDHALTFFEFQPPTSVVDKQMFDSLMAIYGVRDIFMGAAIYVASYFGTRSTLGWILLAASSVAFADGLICFTHGQGQWNHWGYAPMVAIAGSLLLGVFDLIATILGVCQLTSSPPHDIWVHYWAGTMVLWFDDDDIVNLKFKTHENTY